ncbi:hypothetical protein [Kribbella sp. NPDC023855]|uniref:ATP-dependent DNA ligase n=1 Tax=Kribbella sp. NPDC023855 TaxID=3154698 RepID=UPI0033F2394B
MRCGCGRATARTSPRSSPTSSPRSPSRWTPCVLDGELVVWSGVRMDFDALRHRMVNTAATVRRRLAPAQPASLVVFDVLAVGNVDVRPMRWTARRGRLEILAAAWRPPSQLSPVTADVAEARDWLEAFKASGVEGLVVKGAASRYQPGRREWVKVNSVGVAVFDELARGQATRSAMVRGELDCVRHLSAALRTVFAVRPRGHLWAVATARVSASGDRTTR